MVKQPVQLPKVGKTEKQERQSPNFRKYSEVRTREYLLPEEVELMRSAIRKSKGRHAHRDSTLILLTGLTQLSQAMVRLRRTERQTTRGQTWEHPDVLVAELNNLTIIYV